MSELLAEERIQKDALITGEPKVDKQHELDCTEADTTHIEHKHGTRITMKDLNKMIDLTVQSGDRSKHKWPHSYVCCTDQLKLRVKPEDIVENRNKFPDAEGPRNVIPELMKEKVTWRSGWQMDGSHAKPNERLALKGAQDITFVPNKITSSSNGANGYNGLIGERMKARLYQ